jgi:hypothetical protein
MEAEAKQMDLAAATERTNAILHGTQPAVAAPPAREGYHLVTRGKRKGEWAKDRSDKGVPRKQPDAPAGALSQEQWARLSSLFERREQSRVTMCLASASYSQLDAECKDYLDSLKRGE